MSDAELDQLLRKKFSSRAKGQENMKYLSELCQKKNIPLASHDDDSEEKVRFMRTLGAEISEFPVNLEAAKVATELGMNVCVGAPNVLRGTSQVKNLSAREAIAAGVANIICSDYSPMGLLHSIFVLYELRIAPLNELVNLATLNPARAVRIVDQVGSIEIGKEADLILVDHHSEIKSILKTFRSGREIYSCW